MNSPTTRTKRQPDLEGKIRNLDDDSRTAKPRESRNQNKQRQFNLNDDQPQQRPSSSSSWWWYQFLFFTMTCPIKLTTLAVIISRWTRMVKEYTQQISQIRYVPRKKKATTSWRTMSWPTPLVHLLVSNPQVLPDEERLNRAITPKLPIQLMRPFPDFQIEESHYLECRVNRSEPIV